MSTKIPYNMNSSLMKRFFSFCLVLLGLSISFVQAQERCNNGVDDDGDGLIDCYDPDCSGSSSCDNFYFGNAVACADEVAVRNFSMKLQWASEDRTNANLSTPIIGDLDYDGIPEVIVTSRKENHITILNGQTGETLVKKQLSFIPEDAAVIANVIRDPNSLSNKDNVEVLISSLTTGNIVLFAYDKVSGSSSLTPIWDKKSSSGNSVGLVGVADFNEDGNAEFYYSNEIIDAKTGNIIVKGSPVTSSNRKDGSSWLRNHMYGATAVDILPKSACPDCDGLELVTGKEIYSINIANGTRTLVKDFNDVIHSVDGNNDFVFRPKFYYPYQQLYSSVSVADINKDGSLDILFPGAYIKASDANDLRKVDKALNAVFLWDVKNGTYKKYIDPGTNKNFRRGSGRINIGDIDGDGELNINFVMNETLYSLNENMELHWSIGIDEGNSGVTGCSLFDFNGDGKMEILYRGKTTFQVYQDVVDSGGNHIGKVISDPIKCHSSTSVEYPIVVDIDNDGSSEICITCTSFAYEDANNKHLEEAHSHVRVYEADAGEAWLPSRSVWNQHGYFNVNINDDLTVPVELQDHSRLFSSTPCKDVNGNTLAFPPRPLNSFLNQAPILNQSGCVEFVSPDLHLKKVTVKTSPICPSKEMTVTLNIANIGDTDISAGIPISFYKGDPTKTGSKLLDTKSIALRQFNTGDSKDIDITFDGNGDDFKLFVVINDKGKAPPIAPDYDGLPKASVPECKTSNNISSVDVTAEPFTLTTEVVSSNQKCDPTLSTNNGSATAYHFAPPNVAPTPTSAYFEKFDLANNTKKDDGDTKWSSEFLNPDNLLSEERYGVDDQMFAQKMFVAINTSTWYKQNRLNKLRDVNILNKNVVWTSEEVDISSFDRVKFSLDLFASENLEISDFVDVKYLIDGVEKTAASFNKDFNVNRKVTVTKDNLVGSKLVIKVIFNNSNRNEYYGLDNVKVEGFNNPPPKKLQEADGYAFRWYKKGDRGTVLGNSSTISGLEDGTYEVIATNNALGCSSNPAEVVINKESPTLHVMVYQINPLSDCKTPNGKLGAFVYTKTQNGTFPATASNKPLDTLKSTDGYVFSWRLTDDASNTNIATGDVASGLTNLTYTVDAKSNATGCTGSNKLSVSSKVTVPPSPSANIINISRCSGKGEIKIKLLRNIYTYKWYNGSSVKPTPDYIGPDYKDLEAGKYTVLRVSNLTSCSSAPVTFEVTESVTKPAPKQIKVNNNTFCENANGSIQIAAEQDGTTSGYTYQWYLGNDATSDLNKLPGTALSSAKYQDGNPYHLGGLSENTYTVVVTSRATGCSSELVITTLKDDVANNTSVIENVEVTNITSCEDGATGKAFAKVKLSDEVVNGVPVGMADWQSVTSCNSIFEGDSKPIGDNGYQLTPDKRTQFGRVWLGDSLDLSKPIRLDYEMFFGTKDGNGADGFAFVMHRDPRGYEAKGRTNHFLGFGAPKGANDKIHPSIAVEFDTWKNGSFDNYVAFDHMNFVIDGVVRDTVTKQIRIDADNDNVEDGKKHRVTIISIPNSATGKQKITVYVSGKKRSEYEGDLINDIFGGHSKVIAGFTASTGGSSNRQEVYYLPYFGEVKFDWHKSHTPTAANKLANAKSQYLCSADAGDYTLIITGPSGCSSTPYRFKIEDKSITPTMTVTKTMDNYCHSDKGTGTITVKTSLTGATEPSSYTYKLFKGHTSDKTKRLDSVKVVNGTTGHTFSSLKSGTYRVIATNNDTKCQTIEDLSILNNATTPAFSSFKIVDNTSCDATKPNGFITANIADKDKYKFTWYKGDENSTNVIKDAKKGLNSINELAAGTYTVIAQDTITGCKTVKVTKTISNDLFSPSLVIKKISNQTDCNNGNGSLRAYVTSDPIDNCTECHKNYTFQWKLGANNLVDNTAATNGSVPKGVTNDTLQNLKADTYEVIITHKVLGCSTSKLFRLQHEPNNPLVLVDEDDSNLTNSVCENTLSIPYEGKIVVTASFDGNNKFPAKYQWYNGNVANSTNLITTKTTDENTLAKSTKDSLTAGTYSVVVTNTKTGCFFHYKNIIIQNKTNTAANTLNIAFNATDVTASSVCSNDDLTINHNGSAKATVTGGSGNYKYEWFNGTTTSGTAISGQITKTLTGREGDKFYTVRVTDTQKGCSAVKSIKIGLDIPAANTPTIVSADITVKDNNECTASDGKLTITKVDNQTDLTNYQFVWYKGSNVDATKKIAGQTGAILTNQPKGTYTVVAVNKTSGCISAGVSKSIDDVTNFNVEGTVKDVDNCDATNNGEVKITKIDGATDLSGFTFKWHTGSGTGSPIAGATNSSITGKANGVYTVEITKSSGGNTCSYLKEFTIGKVPANPTITATKIKTVANTDCGGNSNGVIDLKDAISPTPSTEYIYDIKLFNSTASGATPINTITAANTSNNKFTGLDDGTYYITIGINASSPRGKGCTPNLTKVPAVIEDGKIKINAEVTDMTCKGVNDGKISISTPDAMPEKGWKVELIKVSDNTTTIISNNDLTNSSWTSAANLEKGDYKIRLTRLYNNAANNCSNVRTVTVKQPKPTIALKAGKTATTTANTSCATDNGTVTVVPADLNLTNIGTAQTYKLYTDGALTGTPVYNTSTTNKFTGIPSGTYLLTVTNNDTKCESEAGILVTVNDNKPQFTINTTIVDHQSSCDATKPNGHLKVAIGSTANGATTALGDYKIEWFSVNLATNAETKITTNLSGTSDSNVTKLAAGTYKVKVSHKTSECLKEQQVTILDKTISPTATIKANGITHNTSCGTPNGSVIFKMDNNGNTSPVAGEDFKVELFKKGETTAINQSTYAYQVSFIKPNLVISKLTEGEYFAKITDKNTNCSVTTAVFEIEYKGTVLTFDPSKFTVKNISKCFSRNGKMNIQDGIKLSGAALNNGDKIVVTWYTGTTENPNNLLYDYYSNLNEKVVFSNITISNGIGGTVTVVNGIAGDGTPNGGLPAIVYLGVAELPNGCKVKFTKDLSIGDAPDVTLTTTNETKCDSPNGSLSFELDAKSSSSPSNYKWYLFKGRKTVLPHDGSNSTTYTPSLSTYNVPVGSLIATGSFSNTTKDAKETINSTNDAILAKLASGDYTLGVEFNNDKCIVYTNVFTIEKPEPVIEIDLTKTKQNTSCDDSSVNGIIAVKKANNNDNNNVFTGNFVYSLFRDSNNDGTYDENLSTSSHPQVTGIEAAFDNLKAAKYRIIALHSASSCSDTLDFSLSDEKPTLNLSGTKTDIEICQKGAYKITSFGQVGSTNLGANNFTYEWFKTGSTTAIDGQTSHEYTGIVEKGNYYVVATYKLNSLASQPTNFGKGCSVTLNFTIEDDRERQISIFKVGTETATKTCSGTGNGTMVFTVKNALGTTMDLTQPTSTGGSNYVIKLSRKDNADNYQLLTVNTNYKQTFISSNKEVKFSELSAGSYRIEVIGCINNPTFDFEIKDEPTVVSVRETSNDFRIENNSICAGGTPNGSVTIKQVFVDGTAVTDLTKFDYAWKNKATNAAVGGNNPSITGLAAGKYTVVVTHKETNCSTSTTTPLKYEVIDKTVNPAVSLVMTRPNTSCNATKNGILTANVIKADGTFDDVSNYTWTWYQGTNTSGAVINTNLNADKNEAQKLAAGDYTIKVQNNASKCITTQTIKVTDFDITSTIRIADSTIVSTKNTSCDNTVGDGSIEVTKISYTNYDGTTIVDDVANWNIEFFTVATGGVAMTSGGSVVVASTKITGLTANTYYVAATHKTIGCQLATRKPVKIIQKPAVFILSTEMEKDAYCDAANGNGKITLKSITLNNNNVTAFSDYTIQWYKGTAASGAVLATTAVLSNQKAGDYTVKVTKNSGESKDCFETKTIKITEESADSKEIKLVENTNYTVTNTDKCNGNGIIDITSLVIKNQVITDFTNFTFKWKKPDGTVFTPTPKNKATDLKVGKYKVSITNTTTKCTTDGDVDIEVKDNTVKPTLSLDGTNAIVSNTHCSGSAAFNGSISVVATAPNAVTFKWFEGVGTSGAVINSNISTTDKKSKAEKLEGGKSYTVQVTDNVTGCSITGTYKVPQNLMSPTLDVASIQAEAKPNTFCATVGGNAHSGSFTIKSTHLGSGTLDDYNIVVKENGNVVTASSTTSSEAKYTNLKDATYKIVLTHKTSNCSTVEEEIVIKSDKKNPQVSLVSIKSDENCGTSAKTGEIKLSFDGEFDHTDGYTVKWTNSDGSALSAGITDNQATLSGVSVGNYKATVTNTSTGCTTSRVYIIPRADIKPVISQYVITENKVCDDDANGIPSKNGIIKLTKVNYNGQEYSGADVESLFTMKAFKNSSLSSPVTDGNPSTKTIFEGLEAGKYFITATLKSSECSSDASEVELEEKTTKPSIAINLVAADSACDASATIKTGALKATVSVGNEIGIDHTNTDYTFQWYKGDNTTNPISGATSSTLSELTAGDYTLKVNRVSTGCTTVETFNVPNTTKKIRILELSSIAATNCAPTSNGKIEVTSVSSDNVSDYTLNYYSQNPSQGSPTAIFVGNNGAAYTKAEPGKYWVIGINNKTKCKTSAVVVEVENKQTKETILLDEFEKQRNCNNANPSGMFKVSVKDGDISNYTFQWFYKNTTDSLTADDYTGGNKISGANTNRVSGLIAGTYFVKVKNKNTGCITTSSFKMVDEITPVSVISSVSQNTNCKNPNGIISIQLIKPKLRDITDYKTYWFKGTKSEVGNNPDLSKALAKGTNIDSLASGIYTAVIIDKGDSICANVSAQVEVKDYIKKPTFDVDIVNEVTVCFENKNGFTRVSLDSAKLKDEDSFSFEWLDFNNKVLSQETFLDSIKTGKYKLKVTNNITGCEAEKIFEIMDQSKVPNKPSVFLSGDRTNCAVPNGKASASVDGNTEDYIFEWFKAGNLTTPYTVGANVANLDSGLYMVRATSIATGCKSLLSEIRLKFEITDPGFKVVTTQSLCVRSEDGVSIKYTGRAQIVFEGPSQLIRDVKWTNEKGEVVSENGILGDAIPGSYTVSFTAPNGCTYEDSFKINAGITIYDGVSANGDQKNDFFLLDCIDLFPNNDVKIYNRTGLIVYSAKGYNNKDIRFEGISNVKSSVKLAAGTYFYVIDLGDGSDIIQGYLELVK